MNYSWHDMHEIDHDQLKYVVILAEYDKQWILIRNKNRTEWELPGGKIEPGEHVYAAACRELFEETGATEFELTPFGIYQLNGSYGLTYHCEVKALGPLPDFEIAEIRLSHELPADLLYAEIYSFLHGKWTEEKPVHSPKALEEKLKSILADHPFLRRDLEWIRDLNLPQWCVAAGYVRNYVWDKLHGYSETTPLNDVDVLYYDPDLLSEETEKQYEAILKDRFADYNWSVKNQARMHTQNKEHPYESVIDAMKRWPETVTAIGVTLDDLGNHQVIAPLGLKDLFQCLVRRSPVFPDHAYYMERVKGKNWPRIWPKVHVLYDQSFIGG